MPNIVRGTVHNFSAILIPYRMIRKDEFTMYLEFVYTLFYDEQAAQPAAFCEACGCERYAPGLHCLRCDRRKP